MPTTPTLPCPRCSYDLATIACDAGVCPECGREFSKATIARRSDSLLCAALMLAGLAAAGWVLAGTVGACFAYLPRSSQNVEFANPDAAARMLHVLPALLVALAIGVLGCLTGVTAWQRRWPALIAAVFVFSMLYALNPVYDPAYSRWLQPQFVGYAVNVWLSGAAPGLAVFAGAAVILRIGRRDGSDALRRAALLLAIAALVGAAVFLLSRWHNGYVMQHTGYRRPPVYVPATPGTPPAPVIPYYRSWTLNDGLVFITGFLEYVMWAGLAALTLLTRAGCAKDLHAG